MKNGTYIAFKVKEEELKDIVNELEKIGITGFFELFPPHVTIISDNLTIEEIELVDVNITVTPSHFEIFKSEKINRYFLVLIVKSKELEDLHNFYNKKYGFNSSSEFIPHITFSMNIEKSLGIRFYKIEAMQHLIKNINIKLPEKIKLSNQYIEELR